MEGNFKVRCIETSTTWYTSGKIYEIKNGKITDDDGEQYPLCKRLENIEGLREYAPHYTWELIEEPKPYTIVKQDKYEVGDKVKVREDLILNGLYNGFSFTYSMFKLIGNIVTIESVVSTNKYRIDELGFTWTNEMLEGKVIETTYREVSRQAEVGEWIKVVGWVGPSNFCGTIGIVEEIYGDYVTIHHDKIVWRKDADRDGETTNFSTNNHTKYVVLENYTPELKEKTIADFTDDELLTEIARRLKK
jgi:hypothetical protein